MGRAADGTADNTRSLRDFVRPAILRRVKIGVNIGYWSPPGPPPQAAELVAEADRLGLDSVWTGDRKSVV